MSAENVDIVRGFLERVNEGDLAGALAAVAADARLDWSGSEAPDRGVFLGHEAWANWMAERSAAMSDTRFEVRELLDAPPDRVVLIALSRGRGRASGIEIEALGAAVFTLRDGLLTRLTLYQSRPQALKAAGLVQ
jgi:ketosteroid isomerase-like protein